MQWKLLHLKWYLNFILSKIYLLDTKYGATHLNFYFILNILFYRKFHFIFTN